MGDALVPVAKVEVAAVIAHDNHPVPAFGQPIVVPALIADVGPRAAKRFANFIGSIANDNTRAAYQRALPEFLRLVRLHRPRRAGRDRADSCRGLRQVDRASSKSRPSSS